MQITVQYAAQIKAAAGVSTTTINVADESGINEVVQAAANQGNENLKRLLLTADGSVQSTLLMFVGEDCVSHGEEGRLKDGDTLTLMSPISGG